MAPERHAIFLRRPTEWARALCVGGLLGIAVSTFGAATTASAQAVATCPAVTTSISPNASFGAGGDDYALFRLLNGSGGTCTLDGYPVVTPVDGSGSPLAAQVTDSPNPFAPAFTIPAVGPRSVSLGPGGSAWFGIDFFPNPEPEIWAAGLQVSLPGQPSPKLIAARGFLYGGGGFAVSAVQSGPPPEGGNGVGLPGVSASRDGNGFVTETNGGVSVSGNAVDHGSINSSSLNAPIVGIITDPATGGYWMVGADGGVFSFDAAFYGSTGGLRLNQPVVGMVATPDGHGYWLVAADGGVFSFGDAGFHGSMGGQPMNFFVQGMAADPVTGGYWLLGADGGVFSFGAPFYGSGASSAPIPGSDIGLITPPAGTADAGLGYTTVNFDGQATSYGRTGF